MFKKQKFKKLQFHNALDHVGVSFLVVEREKKFVRKSGFCKESGWAG